MAKIYPFRGLRYSPEKVSVEKVVTQPYDKISKDTQEKYYKLDPHNIIRIILGKAEPGDSAENNVYTRAAKYLKEWRENDVLVPVERPSFLVYFQRFTVPGTHEERVRKGFVGLGRLEDYENKVIFPHERTLTGPKQDRLQLLRHTRTHFEQIFMLYEDPAQRIDRALDEVAQGKPDIDVKDEYGVGHTLWIVDSPPLLELMQRELADKKLVIADGHHRYETALAYRDERRAAAGATDPEASYERMPMTFFNMQSPALAILPTHRVLGRLKDFSGSAMMERASEFFNIVKAPSDPELFRTELMESGNRAVSIGICTDRGARLAILSLKPSIDASAVMADLSERERTLDVVILHRLLIEKCLGISEEAIKKESHVTYVREFDAAVKMVKEGAAQVSFLLNPTRVDQMRDIAYEGKVMPQKSTDFYPKVLSGLIMYSLE